jgi:iron complex transport system permease protein
MKSTQMGEGPESQLSEGSTDPHLGTAVPDSSCLEGKLSGPRVESAPHCPFGYTIFLSVVTGLLMVAMLLGVAIGSVAIPLPAIIRALAQAFTPSVSSHAGATSSPVFTIVWLMRMPRAVMGALVGAALAVAGAQMQGLFQNPLASPDIIGVSAGGSLGGVIALATGLAARSLFYLPILSFAGALIALQVVYAIATRRARTAVATLLLGGVALTFLIGAITSFLITVTWVRYEVAQQIVFWLMGGLSNRTWTHVWLGIPGIVAGLILAFVFARDLDILAAGEEVASSLGVEVERAKRILLVNAALLTGTAVALSGAIGFVGLVVPHAVRLAIGPSHKRLLPASALAGAMFLVLADLLARVLDRPEEIQVGIITAFFGAPFFLYLLMRRSREEFFL